MFPSHKALSTSLALRSPQGTGVADLIPTMEGNQSPVAAVINGKKARKRTKKHGPLHLVRVAIFMLRRSRKEGVLPEEVVSRKGLWHGFLSTVRLLHHESPIALQHEVVAQATAEPPEAIQSPPMSPPPKTNIEKSPSVDQISSRYASAEDLKELDNVSETDEENEEEHGEHSIDQLAEEFIAKFYEQMRLQRMASIKRYNEMIANGAY